MRAQASIAVAGKAYTSLMARLATLQEGLGPDPAPNGDGGEQAAVYRKRIVRTYFGCGVITSLVVGCAALPLLYGKPAASRNHALAETVRAEAALAGLNGRAPAAAADRIELPVRRSQRANAPFPLQITGAGPLDTLSVMLRDVPEATWLSGGERQDEHTWLLRPADLDNLRLSLRDGTPDAFDMTIEVASAAGDQATRSVVHVRVLDGPTMDKITRAEAAIDPKPASDRGLETPFRTQTTAAAIQQKTAQKPPTLLPAKPVVAAAVEDTTAAAQQLAGGMLRPARPDGMSALGALPHDAGPDVRQMWWKMPMPSWAPFPDRPVR